jgi:hypothetical protein
MYWRLYRPEVIIGSKVEESAAAEYSYRGLQHRNEDNEIDQLR